MAYLEIKLTGGQSRKLVLREGENLLGSGGEAAIVIKDPLVAPVQARLTVKGEHAAIVNLAAAESAVPERGSAVRGARPPAGRPADHRQHPLPLFQRGSRQHPGDARDVGVPGSGADHRAVPGPRPGPSADPAGRLRRFVSQAAPPPPPSGAPFAVSEEELYEFPHLEMTDTTGRVYWILLKDKELLAGSAGDCPLRFDDPLVEPRHAKFIRRDDGVFIVDMESGQGVFLNNRRVFREALKEGDVVRVGHRSLVFHLPRPRPEPVAPPPAAEAAPAAEAPPPRQPPPPRPPRAGRPRGPGSRPEWPAWSS